MTPKYTAWVQYGSTIYRDRVDFRIRRFNGGENEEFYFGHVCEMFMHIQVHVSSRKFDRSVRSYGQSLLEILIWMHYYIGGLWNYEMDNIALGVSIDVEEKTMTT